MTFWIADWLRAFALTVAVELAVAGPLAAAVESRWSRRISAIVLVNLASHPLVWFVFPALALPYAARGAVSEAWAVASEIAAYLVIWPALSLRRAALLSLAANFVSFAAGLVLNHVRQP